VLPPEELARVAARLTDLTRQLVCEPVHFVKAIGDAAMLISLSLARVMGPPFCHEHGTGWFRLLAVW